MTEKLVISEQNSTTETNETASGHFLSSLDPQAQTSESPTTLQPFPRSSVSSYASSSQVAVSNAEANISRFQSGRVTPTPPATASIDDTVEELLAQHQFHNNLPRTEADLREENTRLVQALTVLHKRNAYLKEREATLLKSQSQLRENQAQFSELQAQVTQRLLEVQTREKHLENEREQLMGREETLAQREAHLTQWQTRLEQTEKQLEEHIALAQREWNHKHEELETLKAKIQQHKEQLHEREDELQFLRQQLEQKEKMLDLQQQHYKVQMEHIKEKEEVLKRRQDMLDKQNEELKARELQLAARERDIEESARDLRIKREHLTQLQQQLQELQRQLQQQQIETETRRHEKALERDQKEAHELHSAAKLLERLKTLEAQHTALENEYLKVITELRKSEEMNEILQMRQVALENELDYLKKEIESKNEQFAKLSNQLKDMRLLSSPHGTPTKASQGMSTPTASKPQSSKEKIRRLTEELDNMRLASQAHQTQNAFLSQTINRLLEEKSTEAKAKKKTIEFYQRELAQVAAQYRALRQQVLLAEVQAPNDVRHKLSEEFLKEVDDMKKEFFFTLAIGIKLNRTLQGIPCNLDTHHLWEHAKHLHHTKWSEFLHEKFAQLQYDVSPQSFSTGGGGGGSTSAVATSSPKNRIAASNNNIVNSGTLRNSSNSRRGPTTNIPKG
jgi:chromosome segregation ATPase